MKILLYSLIFAPDVCSNSFVFSDLAKELKNMGHDVAVITTTPHYESTSALEKRKLLTPGKKKWYMKNDFGGIDVYHIVVDPKKGGVFTRLKTWYRFDKYAKKLLKHENIEADVILTQTPPFSVGFTIKKLANKLNAKTVYVMQDLALDSFPKKYEPLMKILRHFEKKELIQMDSVSTISNEMGELIQKKLNNKRKVSIIPNFVDTSLYYPVTQDFREKYGICKDDFVVSYVGNIGSAQDLNPLMELARSDLNVKILIAGNGCDEIKYRKIVEQEKLTKVKFLGYLTREETREINSISDLCAIMLAIDVGSTSFPSKTYSIMAQKKPIIITCAENSSAGNFIEQNKLGEYVFVEDTKEYVNRIEKLMHEKELLDEYGNNAYRMINDHYSSKVVAKQYVELFKSLLEEKK